MAHYLGKINLNALLGVKLADVNVDGEEKKCLVIPIQDNDIVHWKDEWQLWFRAFYYKEPRTKFTHFLMKFIPQKDISRMSSKQIEQFANHSIGAMKKTGYDAENELNNEE